MEGAETTAPRASVGAAVRQWGAGLGRRTDGNHRPMLGTQRGVRMTKYRSENGGKFWYESFKTENDFVKIFVDSFLNSGQNVKQIF